MHPPKPKSGKLRTYWNKNVQELVQIDDPQYSKELKERHKIFSLLVMALVGEYWNSNKRGLEGNYPLSKEGRKTSANTYFGHNIACIAVNDQGIVIDFDFNHNELFNSSMEHAEARLVRRLFRNTKIHKPVLPRARTLEKSSESTMIEFGRKAINALGEIWNAAHDALAKRKSHYRSALGGTTIYTSLESCAQCSGIMTLAGVKEVVYLHRDPGQHAVGNILYNLSPDHSPMPIPADKVGISQFNKLDDEYSAFRKQQSTNCGIEFYRSALHEKEYSPSITSFLCTDSAREIFLSGKYEFEKIELQYPDWKPNVPGAKKNSEALSKAKKFFEYATTRGRRATPHT